MRLLQNPKYKVTVSQLLQCNQFRFASFYQSTKGNDCVYLQKESSVCRSPNACDPFKIGSELSLISKVDKVISCSLDRPSVLNQIEAQVTVRGVTRISDLRRDISERIWRCRLESWVVKCW